MTRGPKQSTDAESDSESASALASTSTSTSTSTWELSVAFAEAAPAAARTKQRVLRWLSTEGFDQVVDGVVDGVDIKVEDHSDDGAGDRAATAFGPEDGTPLLVFHESQVALESARAAMQSAFGERLSMRLVALSVEAWEKAWDGEVAEPQVAGRFAIVPLSRRNDAPGGVSTIFVDAGDAFGDGRHATTLAALEALTLHGNVLKPTSSAPALGPALDVGTGTGVLAIAAAQLGYAPVVATEIDGDALAEAARNAALNQVSLELREGALPPAASPDGQKFALILANILVPVLHDLMPRLAASLATGGVAIFAGFIDKEAPPLVRAAEGSGLTLVNRVERRGWLGLSFRK